MPTTQSSNKPSQHDAKQQSPSPLMWRFEDRPSPSPSPSPAPVQRSALHAAAVGGRGVMEEDEEPAIAASNNSGLAAARMPDGRHHGEFVRVCVCIAFMFARSDAHL